MKGFDNKSNRHEIEILSGNYRNFKRLLDEIYDPDKDDGLKTRAGEREKGETGSWGTTHRLPTTGTEIGLIRIFSVVCKRIRKYNYS